MGGGRGRVVTMADDTEGDGVSVSVGVSVGVGVEEDAGSGDSSSRPAPPSLHQRGVRNVKPKKDDTILPKNDNTFKRRLSVGGASVLEDLPKKAFASDSERMRKIFQILRWHPLEPGYHGGVPYVINFYFHLWAVDEVFDTPVLGVHIPDTIIVQKGSPAHWFYTDEGTMRVMMKDEDLVKDKQFVLSALTQRAGVSQQARRGAGEGKGGGGGYGPGIHGGFWMCFGGVGGCLDAF